MTKWLEAIFAELKGVSEIQESFAEPEEKPGPRDTVVGVADHDLRKLFFVFKQYRKRTLEIAVSISLCGAKEREQKIKEAMRLDTYADALKELFWVSCRHTFPELWDKPSIGVRKGWKVVWSKPEQRGLDLLGAIIGVGALEEMLQEGGSGDSSDEASDPKSRLH